MVTSSDSPIGIMERGAALFIDLFINCLVVLISILIFGSENLRFINQFAIVLVIYSIVYSILLPFVWNGYTLGKRIIGIRIAHISNEKLTLKTMFIRECIVKLFLYSSGIFLFQLISVYMITVRTDKRSIHDLLSGTYVTSDFPEQ